MLRSWLFRGSAMQHPSSGSETSQTQVGSEVPHIVVGGGCFWCTEAVFLDVRGVVSVESGYCGGKTNNPDYESICSGTTGHAEVVRVGFNPQLIDLKTLYQIFFATHDPTTLNRQGYDVGTQYRSAIFTVNDEQARLAKALVSELNNAGTFGAPIVTEIVALERFWVAEAYHQNYFARNPFQGYCVGVVAPKVAKFRKQFASYLK